MKRYLIVLLLVSGMAALVLAAGQKTMSVQMEEAVIRSTPSGFGSVVARARHADQLTVLEEQGAWDRVSTADGKTGWIAHASLSAKKIALKATDKATTASVSSGEMVAAGSGFNKEVEAQYVGQNKDLQPIFSMLDRIEKDRKPAEALRAFLDKGGLSGAKGGAK